MKNALAPLGAISVERFRVATSGRRLGQLVECYRAVFAGHPWNEWKKCPLCNKKWGISEISDLGESFEHCGKPVVDYWPVTTVLSDIRHEITEETSCWVTVMNDTVIGFCWGYPVRVADLDEKLRLPGLATKVRESFGPLELVAYQDELGVVEEMRGRGLAKAMYMARQEDFLARGLRIGVVRTKRTPPSVTYTWFSASGYETIAEYDDPDDRVILARNITGTGRE